MAELDTTIARMLETYRSAIYAKDVTAFMQLYDAKVRVFDTWGVWSYEGAQPWQLAIEAWFTSLGGERVEVSFDDVQASGAAGFAVVSAIVSYTSLSPEGERLRAMQNRLTWALKTSGHVLRVIQEHTSAPVGFDDAKANLVRPQAA